MRVLTLHYLYIIVILFFTAVSCREIELVSFIEEEQVATPSTQVSIEGLYLLNEGNMGSNKCTLDYLDLNIDSPNAGTYYRNIYGSRNPHTVLELGDVGNDLGIYGQRLWMVINCSNKVEVCDARTAQRIGQVDIANSRYLAFYQDYAYISSYAGPVQIDEHSCLGRVYKVDTLTLQKVDSLTVGYQPEEMTISNGKLFVANSGGYCVPNYDNRIFVIDLETFTVEQEIATGINLHRIAADRIGTIWVSSRGDYFDTPSRLYWIAPNETQGHIDRSVSVMSLVGDSLYCMGTSFSYLTGDYEKSFFIVDITTRKVIDTSLFDAPEIADMQMPYGLLVNPLSRDFYLMDAKNCVSSGELLHFTSSGQFDWKVRTGDIPSRGCFLFKAVN